MNFTETSRSFHKPSAAKPMNMAATNLTRLSRELDPDLLAAALMMRESQLKDVLSSRSVLSLEDTHHISEQLTDAGFPQGWLQMPAMAITPKMVSSLRTLASQSSHKAPVRRYNFKRLVDAFQRDINVLADALELVPDAIYGVANGTVVFDEQRMGHVNPRLVEAGFPDNWLEKDAPELPQEWLDGLRRLAVDAHERALVEAEEDARRRKEQQEKAELEAQRLSALAQQSEAARVELETRKEADMATKKAVKAPKAPKATAAKGKAEAPSEGRRTRGPRKSDDEWAISRTRADALNVLLEPSRRGAKAALWDHLMNKSLAYWANVRNYKIFFTDEMAEEVARHLELEPKNWLDNPSKPPTHMAAWLLNPEVPLPVETPATRQASRAPLATFNKKGAVTKATADKLSALGAVVTPQANAASGMSLKSRLLQNAGIPLEKIVPIATAEVKVAQAAAPATTQGVTIAPAATIASPAAAPASPTVQQPVAQVAAPAQAPAAAGLQIPVGGYIWKPANPPTPDQKPHMMVNVLIDQIKELSKEGVFTGQHAAELLYYLSNQR